MPSNRRSKSGGGGANPSKRRRRQNSTPDLGEGEEGPRGDFSIERILARRRVEGGTEDQFEYYIKWVGYGDEHNSWMEEDLLQIYKYWVAEFNRAEGLKEELEGLRRSMVATPNVNAVDVEPRPSCSHDGGANPTGSGLGMEVNVEKTSGSEVGGKVTAAAENKVEAVKVNPSGPEAGMGSSPPGSVAVAQEQGNAVGSPETGECQEVTEDVPALLSLMKLDVKTKENKIVELESELEAAKIGIELEAEKLAKKKKELKEVKKNLGEREGRLDAALRENLEMKTKLPKKEGEIVLIRQELEKTDKQVEELKHELGRKDGQIESLKQGIKDKDKEIELLSKKVVNMERPPFAVVMAHGHLIDHAGTSHPNNMIASTPDLTMGNDALKLKLEENEEQIQELRKELLATKLHNTMVNFRHSKMQAKEMELQDAHNEIKRLNSLLQKTSDGAEDLMEPNGPSNLDVGEAGHGMDKQRANANQLTSLGMDQDQAKLTLAGPPTKTGNDPVITSISSVPHSEMFTTNQKLIKENNWLKSKLEGKDNRIGQLDAEIAGLHSIKDSRRLMESKLFLETNELKDALRKITQFKKDLQLMEEKNTLLHEQVRKIQRENNELAEMVTERDGRIYTFEQELESLENANDHLKESLFKKEDEITALKRELAVNQEQFQYGGIGIPLGRGSLNKDDQAQLQKALNEMQTYNSQLESKVTALTSDNDQLLKKLAEKSTRVASLDGELQRFRAVIQQQKDNLMGKEAFIISLQRALEAGKEAFKPIPTPNQMMESQLKNQLAELEDSMKTTKFKNVRLNHRIGELRRQIGEMRTDNYNRMTKLRGENRQLRHDLIRKDSLLRDRTRIPGSSMALSKDTLTVHKKEQGLPVIDSSSGSDSDDSDNNRE